MLQKEWNCLKLKNWKDSKAQPTSWSPSYAAGPAAAQFPHTHIWDPKAESLDARKVPPPRAIWRIFLLARRPKVPINWVLFSTVSLEHLWPQHPAYNTMVSRVFFKQIMVWQSNHHSRKLLFNESRVRLLKSTSSQQDLYLKATKSQWAATEY